MAPRLPAFATGTIPGFPGTHHQPQPHLPIPDASSPAYEVAHPLDRQMTHFILYDVDDLPAPIHQVQVLPELSIPVELIPQRRRLTQTTVAEQEGKQQRLN
jgi:hypothetical protein